MNKLNRDWGDIAKDLIETALKYANSSAQQIIEEKKKKFGKKVISIILLIIGSLFLLNGLAQFINQLMIDGNWHGYVIVGSVIVLIGMFITKE